MVVIVVFNRLGALVVCFGSAGMDLWFEEKNNNIYIFDCRKVFSVILVR